MFYLIQMLMLLRSGMNIQHFILICQKKNMAAMGYSWFFDDWNFNYLLQWNYKQAPMFCNLIQMINVRFSAKNKMNCELMLTYDSPALRQTGGRNLTGQKTLTTIWDTYNEGLKLVTKYQISAINSCWEKCDEKWAYMFNVYKN